MAVQTSTWWFQSPLETIRTKFTKLDRSGQTAVLVILILVLILMAISLVVISIRHFTSLRFPRFSRTTEYFKLENLDNDDITSNGHQSDEVTTSLTQLEHS